MSLESEKRELIATLIRLRNSTDTQRLNDTRFKAYHLDRNKFNVERVKFLKETRPSSGNFRDDSGRIWEELLWGNWYHTSHLDYFRNLRRSGRERVNRKFITKDPFGDSNNWPNLEYEMVVRQSGQRITSGIYRETYNFCKTEEFSLHNNLDVVPHNDYSSDYVVYTKHPVVIYDWYPTTRHIIRANYYRREASTSLHYGLADNYGEIMRQ